MNLDEKIEKIIEDLIKSGSNISYIKELKDRSIEEVKKDRDLKEVLLDISKDIEYFEEMFLNTKNEFNTGVISGISTGIYLPDYETGSFKYTLIGGNKSRNNEGKIDYDTIFDVASITKLYTLLLVFKLEELGLINLDDKVSDVNSDFKNLGDFTFNDLIKLYGEMRTDGNIALASSYEEALKIFKTLYLVNDDKSKIKYNDFGSMVIADTIEKIISQKFGKQMKFDEIMNEFLFKPLNLNNTMFTPKTSNISGNGFSSHLPHDPKSRALGGVTGHAGIFTNSEDLMKLSDGLFNSDFLDKEHIDRLSKSNVPGASKGNMGAYIKHPDGYQATFNPSEYSNNSFTFQGYTGSISSFDASNKIHNSILVNAIDEEDNRKADKPIGFASSFDEYQIQLVKLIMIMYVVKKYYNKYCNYTNDIEIKKTL